MNLLLAKQIAAKEAAETSSRRWRFLPAAVGLFVLCAVCGWSQFAPLGVNVVAWRFARAGSRQISPDTSIHLNDAGAMHSGRFGVWIIRSVGPFQWLSDIGFSDHSDLEALQVGDGKVTLFRGRNSNSLVEFSLR